MTARKNALWSISEASASTTPLSNRYNGLHQSMRLLSDFMHDGMWVIDRDGITIHVNQAMKRIADIDPEEMIGKHVAVSVEQGKVASSVTLRALEQGEAVTMHDEYDGGVRCLNTSTPIFDDAGEIVCVVSSIRDMTELEGLRQRLAEAEGEARTYRLQLEDIKKGLPGCGFVGSSLAMRACRQELDAAARSSSGILIVGETGAGKTLAAAYLHQQGARAERPLFSMNCAAIPANLLEAELFGCEQRVVSGLLQSGKAGCFELADGGVLLLDEIGELPPPAQEKLLQALDTRSFCRVGGENSVTVDVRVIATSNRSLDALVARGEFRADLYFRLRTLSVRIPPLREHPEDIPELALAFLRDACRRQGTSKTFSPKVLRCFIAYDWPGNVRELRVAVEYLAAMSQGGVIKMSDMPGYLLTGDSELEDFWPKDWHSLDLRTAVRSLEKSLLGKALARGGSSYKAATLLGISQSSVVRKAKQLGLRLIE